VVGVGLGQSDSDRVGFRVEYCRVFSGLGSFRVGFWVLSSSSYLRFWVIWVRVNQVSAYLISGSLGFRVEFFFVMLYFGSDWISDRQTLKLFLEIHFS
jgi:hypothetical protein